MIATQTTKMTVYPTVIPNSKLIIKKKKLIGKISTRKKHIKKLPEPNSYYDLPNISPTNTKPYI